MMERFGFFLVLAYLFLTASGYNVEVGCVDGIRYDIADFTFTGGDPSDYYGNICQNNLSIHSLWAAVKVYCNEREIEAGSKLISGYCQEYGGVQLVPYSQILPDLTTEYIESLPIVEFTDINETKIWDHAVLLSKDFYLSGRRTVVAFEVQYMRHQRYGWAVYGFWGGIMIVGTLNRLIYYLSYSRRTKGVKDVEGHKSGISTGTTSLPPSVRSTYHWIQTNLILPATFGSHHQRLFWGCTLPTRMESFIVLAFWILNLILCSISYELFWPNLYYTIARQGWRYVADRTGIICYANLPLLWMFSGRNNIFCWLTGASFATSNVFHRHIARIATLQAVVHAVCYTVLEIDFQALAESWSEQYWYMGGMATITMGFLVLSSISSIRMHAYEIFLLLHITFSVLTIVGLFYHTAIFDGDYDPYLWSPVAIWLFDRFFRLSRLAYCNLHVKLSSAPLLTKTTARYDADADFVRLDLVPGSKFLKPQPGQHYYLYQPIKWRGWENHPLTLGSWNRIDTDDKINSGQASSSIPSPTISKGPSLSRTMISTETTEPKLQVKEKDIQVATTNLPESMPNPQIQVDEYSGRYKLTFFIRPFNGWTKRLRDDCLKSPTKTIHSTTLIEGPYGETSPLHAYENVVLIAGGTGISGTLPYLQDHVARKSEGRTKTREITFIWATKQPTMIYSIANHELRHYLDREDIKFDFHATSCETGAVTHETIEDRDKSPSIQHISNLRPNVKETILRTVQNLHDSGSSGSHVAILTCGPAAMADEARAAVHQALIEGKRGVAYFEEAFGW